MSAFSKISVFIVPPKHVLNLSTIESVCKKIENTFAVYRRKIKKDQKKSMMPFKFIRANLDGSLD